VPDQAGIVRGYAKWAQEVVRPEMLDRAVGRAVQVAASAPAGLSYLTVSRDVLMDRPRLDESRVSGYPVPVPPAPGQGAVARIAAALAAATAPVLVTSRLGRTAEGFAAAGRLADLAGLLVTGRLEGGPLNLSTRHPMSVRDAGPLTPAGVMLALNEVLDPDDIVVEEAVTNAPAIAQALERTRPGTLTGSAGPGLGWALGGSLGVKLARPDRRVVAVTGDGSFLFGVPTSALMMAAEWGTPFLTVILNNGGYRASRLPVYSLFPGGLSEQRGEAVGTRFTRAPDYPALAAACHARGERVEHADDLGPALRRALAALDRGQAAVIECVIEQD
jgi:thiamine pyrophosphate-dependent acetolactate synthase large subunit-like protein